MKVLISIVSFIFLSSCNLTNRPYIVSSIESYDKGWCCYHITRNDMSATEFQDTCGKYQVGDTLIFVKK